MTQVKEAFAWVRSFSAFPADAGGIVVIPAGAPVDVTFNDFWVSPKTFPHDKIVSHDLATHGCQVHPDNVEETPEIKNLGCINDCGDNVHEAYKKHAQSFTDGKPHYVTTETPFTCVKRYTCYKCGIRFDIDTSD